MRRLNQRLNQRLIKCDASNKISLDGALPSNIIGRIKCHELNATELRRLNYVQGDKGPTQMGKAKVT